jgi:ComF family protein
MAWGRYEGALKRAIAALKYNNAPQLARPLGQALAQVWLASPMAAVKSVTVVPIPMHSEKQKQRGFNQAELLAAAFCDRTGLPLQRHGLVRIRATEAQFTLASAQREQNLAGAFQVNSSLLQQRSVQKVLLLDDIYTTGATVRSAVEALQHHQIPVLGVAAIAKTEQGKTTRD